MQATTNYSSDIVGVKRQLPQSFNLAKFSELCKKAKMDNHLQMEESIPLKSAPEPHIPPLLSTTSKPDNLNMEYVKSLLLLNQSIMTQRYLQLLTLGQCVQQQHQQQHQQLQHHQQQDLLLKQQQQQYQRSLLALKREDSTSSCHSISTCYTSSPVKVPILLKKPERATSEIIPKIDQSPKKSKVSACKNYIALLCTGFARSILTANSGSDILIYLHEMMQIKKEKYPSVCEKKDQELHEYFLEHLYKDICGKRVKKMNKGRDFKVRNSEELELLLTPKEEDSDLVKFRKEVLKEMTDYFFVSKYYLEWLDKGMINQANKDFFLKNKIEIQKKFGNPTLYKPHFDYNSN